MPMSESVDMEALIELSRKVKDDLRELVPDWQARGLIDQAWLEEFEASIDDPMRPPPPPPPFGEGPD